jgi:hypothetical protein
MNKKCTYHAIKVKFITFICSLWWHSYASLPFCQIATTTSQVFMLTRQIIRTNCQVVLFTCHFIYSYVQGFNMYGGIFPSTHPIIHQSNYPSIHSSIHPTNHHPCNHPSNHSSIQSSTHPSFQSSINPLI